MKQVPEHVALSWWTKKKLSDKVNLIKNYPKHEFFFKSPFSLKLNEIILIYKWANK